MVNRRSNSVAEIFDEVQGSRPSRKNVVLLRQQLLETEIDVFIFRFFDCLNRALVCKKSDPNADRIVKFAALFVSLLESPDEEESELYGSFTSHLIDHLLRGIESRDKHVRFRVCQLLAFLMTSGLSEIDEDQFETLQNAIVKRVRDRESNVRVQAVVALSRFQTPVDNQDEEESEDESATKVTEVMLHVLSHDPSPEVRRAALHNISQSGQTLPFLLERARDSDPVLRRQIYSTILPSVNGFKPLSISKRNKLLKWGLKDRDVNVRHAAERMFALDWLNLANGSILELLQRLDIVNSTIGEDVMRAFFNTRKEFIPQIVFNEEYWAELNPESIFLARCMNDFAESGEIAQVVADKLPELSAISDLILKHIAISTEQEEAEKTDTEFVIENLLRLVLKYDFSDEIGRRRITSNCHEILRSNLAENLLVLAVELLSKVSLNELSFTRTIREIVTDIYDALQDENEANESFHSADSSLSSHARTSTPQAGKADDADMQVKYIFTTLRVLSIVNALLANSSSPLRSNPELEDIFKTVIVPAYRSHEGPICERGIECLGQICLQDKDLAEQYLGHFFNCFAKGYEELKILALKCVTDILIAHPSLLQGESTKADSDESVVAEELGGTRSHEHDLIRIYLKAFQLQDSPDVTAMATQSVSKLLLFNVLLSDSENARGLLKEMTVLYYSPESADNQTLRQNLAYFFPVYSLSSLEHQNAMTSVLISSLKKISRLYQEMDEQEKHDAVPMMGIAQQLLDWTNPQRLVTVSEDQAGQLELIPALRKRMKALDSEDKEEIRVLTMLLTKVHIPADYDIESILDVVRELAEDCADNISKRSLAKFRSTLEQMQLGQSEDKERISIEAVSEHEDEGDQTAAMTEVN